MENKLLKILTNESESLANKNKLVTPSEDGAIYIAENQVEDTYLRIIINSDTDDMFNGEIKQFCFITRFNHKKKLQKELKVNDIYREMRKTKTGYLSYKEYMNLNGVFENMTYWVKGSKNVSSKR